MQWSMFSLLGLACCLAWCFSINLTEGAVLVPMDIVVTRNTSLTNNPKLNFNDSWPLMFIGEYAYNNNKLSMMKFAVNYINNLSTLLPTTRLELYGINTDGSKSTTLSGLIAGKGLYNIRGVIGAETYQDTTYVQYVGAEYAIPQINPTCIEASLTNTNSYPYLMRSIPPSQEQQTVVLGLMLKFGITKAVVIKTSNQYGKEFDDLAYHPIAVSNNLTFTHIALNTAGDDFDTKLAVAQQVIPTHRYVIMHCSVKVGFNFLQVLYNAGLVGPQYLYMMTHQMTIGIQEKTSSYTVNWPALDGAIGIIARWKSNSTFNQEILAKWAKTTKTLYFNAAAQMYSSWFAFDAIYSYAVALDNLLRRNYTVDTITGATYLNALKDVKFEGVTGYVAYNGTNGDRFGFWDVLNFAFVNVTVNSTVVQNVTDPITGVVSNQSVIVSSSTTSFNISYRAVSRGNSTDLYSQDSDFVFYGGKTTVPAPYIPCNCFNGANCTENGTCICPVGYSGVQCELLTIITNNNTNVTTIIGGGGGLSGQKLAVVLAVPIVGGILIISAVAYYLFKRKRARLVKEMASKQRSEINRSDIHMEARIGRGASGEVFKGTLRGTDVAVKKLINATATNIEEFMLESAVMCALRHPNIVLFMGSCFDHTAKEMLLVMEFLHRGSLHDILHKPKDVLTHQMKLQIAYQAAVGMNFLHQSDPPIIHRDLKSHNILMDDKYNAKISDFGITKFKELNKAERKKQNISEKTSSLGTIFWTAPEVLDGFEASEKSDCYSFGIVLWELFHMKDPYVGKDPLAVADQVLRKQLRPTLDPRLPEDVTTLIRACWDQDPLRRPTFQDVMVQLKALAAGSGGAISMPVAESIEPPTGFMYIVCMNIDNITSLWENNTRDTLNDINMLTEMYQTQLEVYLGYEFSSELGSCCVAFSKLAHAINWCIATTTKAMQLAYSASLLADPSGCEVRSSTGEVVQRGFRLNFGLFSGTPNCSVDPITNTTNYFGAVVDTTKRLTRIANNGSITASASIIEEYEKSRPNLSQAIITRKYSETLNSARSKNIELYKIIISSLDYKDARTEGNSPHVILTVGVEEEVAEVDGIETITITNKVSKQVKPNWLIEHGDIEIGESIGRGNLGSYYKARINSKEVAVNVLINQKLKTSELLRLMADVTIMTKMNHPNVLPYVGICIEPNHLSLALEYSARNLSQIITNTAIGLTPQIRTTIALGIARGMHYISSQPDIMVRKNDNLKSNNVMVGKDWDVKITDYGQTNIKDFARTMTTVTSVAYTAPELLNGEPASEKVAQFSYGMILWELFARRQPYADEHPIKVVSKICAGYRPPIPSDIPSNFRKIIEGCWDLNPDSRPSWSEIISLLE